MNAGRSGGGREGESERAALKNSAVGARLEGEEFYVHSRGEDVVNPG